MLPERSDFCQVRAAARRRWVPSMPEDVDLVEQTY
jgi:hypothetical protein